MTAKAEPVLGRMKMIKRLNNYILSKIMGIQLRAVGAVVLGGFAGLSLTTTILPTAISVLGVTDDFSARIDLAGLAVYSFMLWAVGGWAAQRTASARAGAVILGLVGSLSAAVFTGLTYGAERDLSLLLLQCTAAGLAYGSFGGMLIAMALGETHSRTSE